MFEPLVRLGIKSEACCNRHFDGTLTCNREKGAIKWCHACHSMHASHNAARCNFVGCPQKMCNTLRQTPTMNYTQFIHQNRGPKETKEDIVRGSKIVKMAKKENE